MAENSNSPETAGDGKGLSRSKDFLPGSNNVGTLLAVPLPGIAIFPQLVSSNPTTLLMESEPCDCNFTLTNADTGKLILKVESKFFSLSHRKGIIDASTGQKLCTIRQELFSGYGRYYAETIEKGPHIFDAELSRPRGPLNFKISFENTCSKGEMCSLDFQTRSRQHLRDGTVFWEGRPVACVRRTAVFRRKYEIAIASGLDPFVVFGFLIAVECTGRQRQG